MDTSTIQHVFAAVLVQGVLLLPPAHAQIFDTDVVAHSTDFADSAETSLSMFAALLSGLQDPEPEQEQDEEDQTRFTIEPLTLLPPTQPRVLAPDPLRRRKGGLWSVGQQWSVGVGLVRAGGPKPENRDRPNAESEPMWMDVEGTEGLVHMLDASVSWVVDPSTDVQLSFEGGLRTLARSSETSGEGERVSTPGLNDSLVTVPVMGATVRWSLTDWMYIEGSATGNVMDDVMGSFLDLTAQAGVSLTSHTALIAGYRYLDASFDTSGDSATLSQDAIFAMLQIRY